MTVRPNLERCPPEDCQRPDPGVKLDAHADQGTNTNLLGLLDDQFQIGVLFDHHENLPADPPGKHCHFDEVVVLEAIADDRHVVAGNRNHRQQLGLVLPFSPK